MITGPSGVEFNSRTSSTGFNLAGSRATGHFPHEPCRVVHHVDGAVRVGWCAVADVCVDLLDGDCLTVTGKTLAENLAELPDLKEGQTIVQTVEEPIKETGHLQILKGNLAPEGAVAKITGKEGLVFSGVANVFDSEEAMLKALEEQKIKILWCYVSWSTTVLSSCFGNS